MLDFAFESPLWLAMSQDGSAIEPGTEPAPSALDDSATQAPGGTGTPPAGNVPGWYGLLSSPLIPLILIFVVFYFFMISGNRRKEKQRQELVSSLARGDRVTTIGGIIGNVVDASGDEVVLKIDENNNTKMRITRGAVASVVKADGSDKK